MKGVLATVPGDFMAAIFGVGHGAEEGEDAAGDPDGVDEARGPDGGHHLARDEEDAGADDDADHDGGRVGAVEDAWELVGGIEFRHGLGRVACGLPARLLLPRGLVLSNVYLSFYP